MTSFSTYKNATTSSILISFIPPDFVKRVGAAHISSYGNFFSQALNISTNRALANGLKLFCDFLTKSEIEDLSDIEPKHINEFVKYTSDNSYGVATTRLYLSAVKFFLDGCVDNKLISVNPAKSVWLID